MFRHIGKTRTLGHNLKIASLLSFVAGLVNVVGFFSVQRLTTNVTGHFAFLIDEVFKLHAWGAWIFFSYILFFFLGSLVSNFLVEIISRRSERFIYSVPAVLEAFILVVVSTNTFNMARSRPNMIACALLFAMGLQNSLVTGISKAQVRTTHLTGLFTDLGIELSQLFFYKTKEQSKKLISSIKLRGTIIISFFMGGIVGGITYSKWQLKALNVGAFLLLSGLIYDTAKFRLIVLRRRLINKEAAP